MKYKMESTSPFGSLTARDSGTGNLMERGMDDPSKHQLFLDDATLLGVRREQHVNLRNGRRLCWAGAR